VLVVDDHPIFRDGLLRLLDAQPDIEVAGEAGNGDEAVRAAKAVHPDLVLLDLAMPGRAGLDVLPELAALAPHGVLLLTASITREQTVQALQLGARGVVRKEIGTTMLYKAIRAAVAGEYWVDRGSVGDLVHQLRQDAPNRTSSPKFGLTKRELEIVAAIVAGCTNRDIARQFNVSQDTVKHHVSNVFDKVGVSNRLELAMFAINHELVEATHDM
jgi:two-component system, NarL family, nitrate/nitrite response regulator NarL